VSLSKVRTKSRVVGFTSAINMWFLFIFQLVVTATFFLIYRVQDVSSNALMPTWIPYAFTKFAEELLVFSLKLMTGW